MDEQIASTSTTSFFKNASETTWNGSSAFTDSQFMMTDEMNNEEINSQLLLTVYKYLQQQTKDNETLTASQKESLEVAAHCLGYAFQFFEFDFVEHDLDEIFEFFEKHKHDAKKKQLDFEQCQISAADMVKANEYKEKGNKSMRDNKVTEALKYYEKAIRFNPKEPALYCNRAAAYSKLNKFKEAVEDCDKAISLDGSYAKAFIRRALAYENLRDDTRALKSYKKACLLEPENQRFRTLYKDAYDRVHR